LDGGFSDVGSTRGEAAVLGLAWGGADSVDETAFPTLAGAGW